MYDIINLFNIKDKEIKIININVYDDIKEITIEKELVQHFCPKCGFRMHSKGIQVRTLNHQILQDGYKLVLKLRQRRWKCTNPNCKFNMNDSFSFVQKNRRTTNVLEILVVQAYKDLHKTSVQIAKEFNISDHLAMDIFKKHIQMERSPLPEIISVDEVHLDIDKYCPYALVIQDFFTGEPIDLVRSRQQRVTEPYFRNIPYKERCNVKYIISDMYNPYINYTHKYFPNATSIVDSFHVMQYINNKIEQYCRDLKNKFKKRDKDKAIELALAKGKTVNVDEINVPLSDEVYLLQKHRWVILKNQDNIVYSKNAKYNAHFKCYLNTYALEEKFLSIDKDLSVLRELKELYVVFNNSSYESTEAIAKELDYLIGIYEDCGNDIFNEFSNTLKNYRQPIINSFTLSKRIIKGEIKESRLSNGPIEALNRKVKDLKRYGNGYVNFDNVRNRFLYSTRKDFIFKN